MSSPETSINPPKDNNGAKAMNRCEVKSREIWNFIPFRIMSWDIFVLNYNIIFQNVILKTKEVK